jgi:uncharacterized repeat protein (TIGR01451 family)
MTNKDKQTIIVFVLLLFITISASAYAARRASDNYGIQSDVADQGGSKSTSESFTLRQGSAGQHGAVGQSDSSSYGSGQGYIYTTNTKPLTPESLEQYRANGTSIIPWPAGWTSTSTEVMKMDISDPDPGDILKPEIEVLLSGESFTGSPSFEGSNYDYSGVTLNASVTATGMEHAQDYVWQARVKDLENYYSDWVTIGITPLADYRVDLVPPLSSESLFAYATPEPIPSEVLLTWEAGTDALSGVAGYNLYRSITPGSGYSLIQSNIPDLATFDATVFLGTDYYYVITTVDQGGGESGFSEQASAPYLTLTREATVEAPVSGGYAGAITDAVPGSIIRYIVDYSNLGYAVATSIEVIDKVPSYTEFKIGSATGDAVIEVKYSNNFGITFDYTPSGTYVDPDVTHIKWICDNSSSGITKEVEFSVVIR